MSDPANSGITHRAEQSHHPNPGLCASCKFAQTIPSIRGSEFVLCNYSRIDPAFPKYPTLPIRECRGFVEETP